MRGRASATADARVDPRASRLGWQGSASLREMAGTTLAALGGSPRRFGRLPSPLWAARPAMTSVGQYEREALLGRDLTRCLLILLQSEFLHGLQNFGQGLIDHLSQLRGAG